MNVCLSLEKKDDGIATVRRQLEEGRRPIHRLDGLRDTSRRIQRNASMRSSPACQTARIYHVFHLQTSSSNGSLILCAYEFEVDLQELD